MNFCISVEGDTYCKLIDMKYNIDEFSNILQKKKYNRLRFTQDIHIYMSAQLLGHLVDKTSLKLRKFFRSRSWNRNQKIPLC